MAQVECSCRFIDSICSSERLDSSVFTCSINLLPTDVAHCVEGRYVHCRQGEIPGLWVGPGYI